MSWLGYSLFVLLSLVLGVISAFLWMINPFTAIFFSSWRLLRSDSSATIRQLKAGLVWAAR